MEIVDPEEKKWLYVKLGLSFFLFGLINNVLYVIILSAALDLVPPSTPKGVIAFCNIAPALVAKLGCSYILKGRIHYARRLFFCCLVSFCGMLIVAMFDSLYMRLLGICFASFSSGLGEVTFLQLSSTYQPPSVGGHCVGYFSSGTGAAGLVGAFLWWEVRSFGVRIGVGMSSVLPFVIPITFFFLLPRASAFHGISLTTRAPEYQRVASNIDEETENDNDGENEEVDENTESKGTDVTLSVSDKWQLVKPMLLKYMLPLFSVYVLEYTINQGIAPTLVYPVPDPNRFYVLGKIIHSVRDYYPFWQLVYQTSVFLSRSSISLNLPPLPEYLLPIPAVVQGFVLVLLVVESAIGGFGIGLDSGEDGDGGWLIWLVFLLIGLEGTCGGLAYVNVFYHINQSSALEGDRHPSADPERSKQEREFKIGSLGFADSTGIMLASILAMPMEVELCRAQVRRGKTLCQGL